MSTRLGQLKSFAGTDPAANVEIIETVPADEWWELLGMTASLVADANVANRNVTLLIDDGTTTLWRSKAGGNQVASGTTVHVWATDMVTDITAPTVLQTFQIPRWILAPGYRVQTSTANRQATDNWGAPQILAVVYDADPTGWV